MKEKKEIQENDNLGTILAIILASNHRIGFISPLILYCYSNILKDNYKIYSQVLIEYRKILENYKKLAEELKVNDSLNLSHLFSHLLWNGYFSVTKEHHYNLNNRLMISGKYSLDVIKGSGVCLTYAELLANFLNVCDKEAALLNSLVPTKKGTIKINYYPEIERKFSSGKINHLLFSSFMFFLKPITKIVGNHAVTLIKDNSKMFVYDPTNLAVLKINDKNSASIINGYGTISIKPMETLFLEPNCDPHNLSEQLILGNSFSPYSRKEIIFTFEEIIELVKSNINLLDSAYDNIHHELEFISQQIDEIGKNDKTLVKSPKTK